MFDGACRCSCERATLGCLDGWMRLTNWELQFRQHSIYFGTSGVHSQAWRPGTPPRSVASPMEHLEPVLQERPIEGSASVCPVDRLRSPVGRQHCGHKATIMYNIEIFACIHIYRILLCHYVVRIRLHRERISRKNWLPSQNLVAGHS